MKEKPRWAWTRLWTLLTDWGLLFLALASTAFGAVSAYHIKVVTSAVWVGAFVLSWAALGLVSLSKHRLSALIGAFSLWSWGLWRLWKPLVWGGTRIQCDVVNTIAAKIPTVSGIAPVAELPEEVWPLAATLWILMVGCVYALVLGWLLCRARHGLPAALWMLLPILPAVCVTEAPDALPMAGMLAVWLTLALTSLTEKRDPAGTARLRPLALLCALLTLGALGEKLPTHGTAQPLWAADIREAVINEASRGDFSSLLTRWSGWIGAGSTEYMNLLGSALSQTGRVALRVESGRGGKYYLRGYSADVYTGRRWEPMGREAKEELETIRDAGVEPLLLLGESARGIENYWYREEWGSPSKYTATATMKVENVAAPGGCVYYPYGLLELPEDAGFGGDSHLERTGAVWEHTVTYVPHWERAVGYALSNMGWYDIYGLPRDYGTEDPYGDFVREHELQVPEALRPALEKWLGEAVDIMLGEGGETEWFKTLSLEEYVRYCVAYDDWTQWQWGQWIEDSQKYIEEYGWEEDEIWGLWDTYDGPLRGEIEQTEVTQEDIRNYGAGYISTMCDLVREYLAQTTRYDRDTPAPPAGRDYVDWFLNESRQGYCMHYATAATLLLRTAGIPARYVSGYVVDVPYSGKAEVSDYSAHAWVEVYLDGVGWYPLEVTPGFQSNAMGDIPALEVGEGQTAARPSATPRPTPVPTVSATPSAAPSAAPTPSAAPGQTEELGQVEKRTVPGGVWAALGVLLLGAGAVWGRKGLLKRRRRRLRGENTNGAALYAYRCHRALRSWGGQENGELTALAEKARFSQHILTRAERDRGVELFEEEVRWVRGKLPGWKRVFFTLWWGK